ncbi:MAG: RNA methyltransferase [Anaerolineales bacterium]|nr:RNA methyltransferase [Anaerolineales bacterium]
MLTSPRNPRIQHIRALQARSKTRRESKQYVVEGVRLVEEALLNNSRPELLLYMEDLNERSHEVLADFQQQGVETLLVSAAVMQAASDTQTPQGLLAVLPIPDWQLPEQPNFLLVADQVRDPGNLGTLLRTALAAGVQAVLLPPGNVDPFSPKVIRAAMGAHFRLPVLQPGWGQIQDITSPLYTCLADSSGGLAYTQADLRRPLALLIGGEASGAGQQALKAIDTRLHIPMPGGAESLNAAVAAAILLFEVVRQRGGGAGDER